MLKSTAPVGVPPPFAADTVAVNWKVSFSVPCAGLTENVTLTALVAELHCETKLFTSMEPIPVARSYPGPAWYPKVPDEHSGLPCVQVTVLPPDAMS